MTVKYSYTGGLHIVWAQYCVLIILRQSSLELELCKDVLSVGFFGVGIIQANFSFSDTSIATIFEQPHLVFAIRCCDILTQLNH